MIKSEKQYKITKGKKDDFIKSLILLKSSKNDDLLNEIMIDSLKSQIETFDLELSQYETLKNEKPQIIAFNLEELPESLIKARIVKDFLKMILRKKQG
ncbi:MAG: hypothetical protein IPJ22_02415 [Bacteroidetes bacterium]|nr:hypothetical protein [Bacteroidota bacterium]